MAGVSYIGKAISLVSHSDIRYRGILHGIDPAASTISLANVISMGTENRRPSDSYIPPSDVPYEFIIFRASEVKDIAVDQVTERPQAPQRNVHDDPAVMTVSAPPPHAPPPSAPSMQQGYTQPRIPEAKAAPLEPTSVHDQAGNAAASNTATRPIIEDQEPVIAKPKGQPAAATRSVDGANTGMENVQRAMGELRVSSGPDVASNGPGRGVGARRGGRNASAAIRAGEISIPSTEFDFARSNARFDKAAVGIGHEDSEGDDTNPSEEEDSKAFKGTSPVAEKAYNPKSSFFDSLTSGPQPVPKERVEMARGGYPSRGKRGGSRREEERQRNVATFGEPGGGPGLMGPGAYVPGWGGGGRRGQGRGGRRGVRQTQ